MNAPNPLPSPHRGGIAPEDRARRQASIDFARGSVALEGFALSDEAEAINRRYVDGDMTLDEHIAAIRALGEA